MGHRSKSALRCDRCRMHRERCICEHLPRFDLPTRLCLIMHCKEVQKPTATGPMALAALSKSELYVHGVFQKPLNLEHLYQEERRVFLLFPSEDARPLERTWVHEDPRPVTLVVPDGSWRQASRTARRIPGLDRALKVTLPPGPPTRWGIRRETKEGGLATFEAIARAFGILESEHVQTALEQFFEKMVLTSNEVRGYFRPTTRRGPPVEQSDSEERDA